MGGGREPAMDSEIATEVRDAAECMAVDGLGNLRIGGDGLKNAGNGKDVDRPCESGAVGYDGTRYRVNEGYASLSGRIWKGTGATGRRRPLSS